MWFYQEKLRNFNIFINNNSLVLVFLFNMANTNLFTLSLSTHILFGLRFDSSKFFWKTSVIVIHFLSFKEITHIYLLKISITHNENLNNLLNLLINYISARSVPKILSIKSECNFFLLNFLIIGVCNSSTSSLLEIVSFFPVPSEVFFYHKLYAPLKQIHINIHNISGV